MTVVDDVDVDFVRIKLTMMTIAVLFLDALFSYFLCFLKMYFLIFFLFFCLIELQCIKFNISKYNKLMNFIIILKYWFIKKILLQTKTVFFSRQFCKTILRKTRNGQKKNKQFFYNTRRNFK